MSTTSTPASPGASTTLLDDLDDPAPTTASWTSTEDNAAESGLGLGLSSSSSISSNESDAVPPHRAVSKNDVEDDDEDDDEDSDDDDSDDSLARGVPRALTPAEEEDHKLSGFRIGFAEDRNKKYRRTMEAGLQSLTATQERLRQSGVEAICMRTLLADNPDTPVPELLNKTFLLTDIQLGERKGLYSGCTAVVAFLRTEYVVEDEGGGSGESEKDVKGAEGSGVAGKSERPVSTSTTTTKTNGVNGRRRRVLYTANVGDARAVLCRDGNAIRLSYDHKGSDPQEAQRIVEAGGFVMNNRVNGVLAVTRSLGDVAMKEWIIGSPYTTETVLNEKDSFLILACDGVGIKLHVWDVCSDQAATDLIRSVEDPQKASEELLEYALTNFSTDNLSVMVIRFDENFLSS
ncbi:Protein phosphatase 2C 1 [Quaeritorhiza haematococci]|nr:Protein phosphatase 2C 1 [Quaeritorhiza haematococci]